MIFLTKTARKGGIMSQNDNEFDTYYIPPNFIEGGTVMGGLFKLKNVIEAGILAFFVGMPIFMLEFEMSVKAILLCFTVLPLVLFALIGISGESLSSYFFGWFNFLINRRVVGKKNDKKKEAPDNKETNIQ